MLYYALWVCVKAIVNHARRPGLVSVVFWVCLGLTQAVGQLPAAHITALFPLGCPIGGEVEIQVRGSDLDGAKAMHFSHPGISAKLTNSADRKFKVQVTEEVPIGVYEARLSGVLGLSNSRLFVVSSLAEIQSAGKNTGKETALTLTEDTVVNAVSVAKQSLWYRVKAKKGQRLMLRASASSLDSRMKPVMTLRGGTGERLAKGNSNGLIDYTVRMGGDFYIQVHDLTFNGGTEYFYRLENLIAPHVDFVMPPIVPSFDNSVVTLYGRNLPGSEPAGLKAVDGQEIERLVVNLSKLSRSERPGGVCLPPASAVVNGGVFRLTNGKTASNPFFIGQCGDSSLRLELESVNTETHPQNVSVSTLVAGAFFPARDIDHFKLPVKKAQVYWLKVFSDQLGYKTNPYITAQLVGVAGDGKETADPAKEFYDLKGNPGGRKFNVTNRDMSWRFEPKEDGYCRVTLRDLFNQTTNDPSKGYVMTLRREEPDFRLVAHPETVSGNDNKKKSIELMVTHLRKGGTRPVRIVALREGNYNGPITITAKGLPEGIMLHPCEIKSGENSSTAFLTAHRCKETYAGNIQFEGKAKIGDRIVVRTALYAVTIYRVGDYEKEPVITRFSKEYAISVNADDPEPIQLTFNGDNRFTGLASSKINIPLTIKRISGYNETIKLNVIGVKQLVKFKGIELAKEQTEAKLEIDLAKYKIPPGIHSINLAATVKGKYKFPSINGNITEKHRDVAYQTISPPVEIEVKANP